MEIRIQTTAPPSPAAFRVLKGYAFPVIPWQREEGRLIGFVTIVARDQPIRAPSAKP